MSHPREALQGPVTTTAQVEELARALCKRMSKLDDREQIEQEGLHLIRSYRMQLHFKAAFAKAVDELQLAPARSGSKGKGKRRPRPKASQPLELTREEFLSKMVGKPLAVIATKAGMNVSNFLQTIRAHGYVDKGSWTPLQPHLIPLLLDHLPERIDAKIVSRTNSSRKGAKQQSSPSKIQRARSKTTQGLPGNYFKLIFNRSKY